MTDNLVIALQFEAAGVPKTIGQVKNINNAVKRIQEENRRAAGTAEALAKAYGLSEKEIRQTIAAVDKLEAESTAALNKIEAQAQQANGALRGIAQGVGQQIGQQLLSSTQTAIAGVPRAAIQSFRDLDDSIRQTQVITQASEEDIASLRAEVERLGIVTSATPGQIGELSVALSRAGFSAQEQTQAFEGIIRAAEATGASLGNVGELVGTTIRTFGLAASDSEKVADILVSATNSTNTSIESLTESLKFIGPSAAAANQPLEDITALIGLLGDQGILGSQAGTNLASGLDRLKIASAGANTEFSELVRGSARQTEAFEKIGAEVRNADGTMRSVAEIIPVIRDNISDLSQEDTDILLKALFGVEGGRAFQALLNTSQERIEEVTGTVQNSAGIARESGEALLQGFGGAVNLFEGSLAGAQAAVGSFIAGGAEPLIRSAAKLLNVFIGLPAPIQRALLATTSFATVMGLAAVAVAAYNTATAQRVRADLAAAAGTIKSTAATAANTIAAQAAAAAQAILATATGQATSAQVAQTQALAANAVALGAFAGAIASVKLAADTFSDVTARAGETRDAIADVEAQLAAIDSTGAGAISADLTEAQANANELANSFGPVQQGLDRVRDALGLATVVEAETNRSKIAFNELVSATDEVRLAAAETAVALENGVTVPPETVEGTVTAIDAAVAALEAQKPVVEEEITRRDAQLAKLREYRDRITGTTQGVVALTEATGGLGDALEQLNADIDAAGAAIEGAGSAAQAALAEQRAEGAISAEDYERQLTAIQQNGASDRIAAATAALGELRELEAAASDPDTIEEIQGEILKIETSISKERISIALATAKQKEDAEKKAQDAADKAEKEATKAAKERAKEEREAAIEVAEERSRLLKQQREEEERAATRAFDDSAAAAEARLAEEQRQAEEAFNREQRQAEQAFQDALQADERAFEAELESRKQAFQDRQQSDAREFEEQLQARRDEGSRTFDALESEVDRRIALANAATKEEREAVEARIEAEAEALEQRRKIEAEVLGQRSSIDPDELGPLEEARRDFELQLQEQQRQFQEAQAQEAQLFEEQLQAEKTAAEADLEERRRAFEESQRQTEQAFQAEQRRIEEAFQQQQQQAERTFKDEQRRLDRANAETVRGILEQARSVGQQSLRSGGVAAGGVVQVHKDEFIIPPQGTRVVSQAQSRQMVQQYLSQSAPRVVQAAAMPSNAEVVQVLNKIYAQLQGSNRRARIGGGNTYNIQGAADPVAAAQQLALRNLRGGLR